MIKLKELIQKHPECLDSSEKLRSYLKDLYPNEKARINIIVAIFSCDIHDSIKTAKALDSITISNFAKRLENEYGYSINISKECIELWVNAYKHYKNETSKSIENSETNSNVNKTKTSVKIRLGDYIQMGTYYGKPIFWRCVSFEKISGYDGNGNPIIDSTDTVTEYQGGIKKMNTRVSKEMFLEMKHQKELGVPATRIAEHFNMSVPTVHKWLRMDEDVIDSYIQNSRPYLEQYRAFILSILKVCPQTQATNIMYRIKDEFPDFECGKTAFFKYVKALREETGYVKPERRETSFREQTKPGYEAQVDFGQYRMKDMYDRNLVIYFFCMVLSYSRMRFVYFSREPFKTKTAIAAHNMAFRYFGGRTETILYDQDKVFVTSEHYGNIVLAAEFERYVKKMGFSVILCNKRDPQTKGKVESFVRYVKEGFLQGRIYSGIDSLNSAALEWLDKECNGTTHDRTRRTPRDMFREESKALTKVHFEDEKCEIRAVSEKYAVIYDWTKYELHLHRFILHI